MGEAEGARALESRLATVLKAVVVGSRTQAPSSLAGGEGSSTLFAASGALEPPYDPEALCLILEHSNALRQNVDAYATNIDGFGYRLDPAIDFDADDADRKVADTLYLERLARRQSGELSDTAELEPSAEEVTARRRELQVLARAERGRLESFFDFCCFDHSFVDLRRRTRQDLEVTGNAYWEALRNGLGEVARLVYVPMGLLIAVGCHLGSGPREFWASYRHPQIPLSEVDFTTVMRRIGRAVCASRRKPHRGWDVGRAVEAIGGTWVPTVPSASYIPTLEHSSARHHRAGRRFTPTTLAGPRFSGPEATTTTCARRPHPACFDASSRERIPCKRTTNQCTDARLAAPRGRMWATTAPPRCASQK